MKFRSFGAPAQSPMKSQAELDVPGVNLGKITQFGDLLHFCDFGDFQQISRFGVKITKFRVFAKSRAAAMS